VIGLVTYRPTYHKNQHYKKMSSVKNPQSVRKGANCIICNGFFDIERKDTVVTKCKHAFHRHCLEGVLSQVAKCPICKTDCQLKDVQNFKATKPTRNTNTSLTDMSWQAPTLVQPPVATNTVQPGSNVSDERSENMLGGAQMNDWRMMMKEVVTEQIGNLALAFNDQLQDLEMRVNQRLTEFQRPPTTFLVK
jgi:hypothetical protein